jgi:hypothetical protein
MTYRPHRDPAATLFLPHVRRYLAKSYVRVFSLEIFRSHSRVEREADIRLLSAIYVARIIYRIIYLPNSRVSIEGTCRCVFDERLKSLSLSLSLSLSFFLSHFHRPDTNFYGNEKRMRASPYAAKYFAMAPSL